MIRLLIFAITMLLLSSICNGQTVARSPFGAQRTIDTSYTGAQLKLSAYGGSLDTMLMTVMPNGDIKKVAKNQFNTTITAGYGLDLVGTSLNVDTTIFFKQGGNDFGISTGIIGSTTGSLDIISYNDSKITLGNGDVTTFNLDTFRVNDNSLIHVDALRADSTVTFADYPSITVLGTNGSGGLVDNSGLIVKYADTPAILASYFKQNGSSFGTTARLGTNDAQDFAFKTSGIVRMTILSNGRILFNDAASNGFDNFEFGDKLAVTNATNTNIARIWYSVGTKPTIQLFESGVSNVYIAPASSNSLGGLGIFESGTTTYQNLFAATLHLKAVATPSTPNIWFVPVAPKTLVMNTNTGQLFVDSIGLIYTNKVGREGRIMMNNYGSASNTYTVPEGQSWLTFTGSSAVTWTLPTPRESVGIKIKNKGTATLTLSGSIYDRGIVASMTLLPSSSVWLIGDGTHWVATATSDPFLTTTSAGTLTLSASGHYIATGTTSTWTLPAVTGTSGTVYHIKNRGSGTVTINTTASANHIYSNAAVNTYALTAGSAIILVSDGSFYNVE